MGRVTASGRRQEVESGRSRLRLEHSLGGNGKAELQGNENPGEQ